jgi:hypothetical protein
MHCYACSHATWGFSADSEQLLVASPRGMREQWPLQVPLPRGHPLWGPSLGPSLGWGRLSPPLFVNFAALGCWVLHSLRSPQKNEGSGEWWLLNKALSATILGP